MLEDVASGLGKDLFGEIRRHGSVFTGFHRVGSSSLGHASENRRVSEHFRERDVGVDDPRIPPDIAFNDLAPSTCKIAADGAEEFIGSRNEHPHDRLQECQPRLGACFAEGKGAGLFEGDLA